MSRPDPVLQVLQRKAYRVRCAHPDDKRAQGSALLKTIVQLLDSKVGRNVDGGADVVAGERSSGG